MIDQDQSVGIKRSHLESLVGSEGLETVHSTLASVDSLAPGHMYNYVVL